MDIVFKIRLANSGLGPYNATKISIIYVVASSSKQAIDRVLAPETISVEILESNPCLIVE